MQLFLSNTAVNWRPVGSLTSAAMVLLWTVGNANDSFAAGFVPLSPHSVCIRQRHACGGMRRCGVPMVVTDAGDDDKNVVVLDAGKRRSLLQLVSGACMVASLFPNSAVADDALLKGLQPPSKERPQIPFPDVQQQQQQAILEGLLYLENPTSQRRPTASDVILLFARIDETILGASQLPVSNISLPLRFTMTPTNRLVSVDAWNEALRTSDMILEAIVCNRDSVVVKNNDNNNGDLVRQCRQQTTTNVPMQAKGVAKLLRVRSSNGSTVIIRAPVSLPLS